MNWTYLKGAISDATGLSPDCLHIQSGLLILVLAAMILRRPPWTWQPWLAVLVAETINESYDLLQAVYPTDEHNIPASLHDFWLTMFWPSAILLVFPRLAGTQGVHEQSGQVRRFVLSRQFALGFTTTIMAVWLLDLALF